MDSETETPQTARGAGASVQKTACHSTATKTQQNMGVKTHTETSVIP